MSENTANTNENEWRSRELGALWIKSGRSQKYLTGTIRIGEFGLEQEVKVIIFSNKHKSKNDKAPDYLVYESQDRAAYSQVDALSDEAQGDTSKNTKELQSELVSSGEEIPEAFQ
jgi:hypothetical protein